MSSTKLLALSDDDLLAQSDRSFREVTEGTGFGRRGWYHQLYLPLVVGKKVLDIGCGLGTTTIMFAQRGAQVTFIDIMEDNVRLVERLCRLKGVANAKFLYMENFESLGALDYDYDVVTALGSLINAPLAVTKREVAAILPHLRAGGRWLMLSYPKLRWEREGRMDFRKWGEVTDGPGTPWMEWHDRGKVEWLFEPADARILYEAEYHNRDFNWFDIELLAHAQPDSEATFFTTEPRELKIGAEPQIVRLAWNASMTDAEELDLILVGPTGKESILSTQPPIGQADTGPWAVAGQRFLLRDHANGRRLASAVIVGIARDPRLDKP